MTIQLKFIELRKIAADYLQQNSKTGHTMKNRKLFYCLKNVIFRSFLIFEILVPSNINAQISNYWGCGSSFVTCGPGNFDIQNETFTDGLVCGIIDVRQTCDFVKPFSTSPPFTGVYASKMFPPLNMDWYFSNLGTVFSAAVDIRGDIFVATTTTFGSVPFPDGLAPNGGRGSGSIHKISGSTGLVNTGFVTTNQATTYNPSFPNRLPNQTLAGTWGPSITNQFTIKSGAGLGDLTYNKYHDFIYVSNFEDGKIYKINPTTGNVENVFDPTFGEGNPAIAIDNGLLGFSPRGQRPWGLGIYQHGSTPRLYYSNWKVDAREKNNPNSEHNEIWSIELDINGNPVGLEKLEIIIDFLNNPPIGSMGPNQIPEFKYSSSPVSDISFSETGVMLLAEKGMEYDFGYVFGLGCGSPDCNSAHQARLMQYTWNGTSWQIFNNPKFYELASSAAMTNCAGGVDVGYNTCDADNACDSLIWVTGDFNHVTPSVQIYGSAGIEFGNGAANNHRYIDFNGQTNNVVNPDKLEIGDVEIFRCDVSCINCCDSIKVVSIDACCSKITSFCDVVSVQVQVQNGVISSGLWNCGALPANFIDQTVFTFTPGSPCILDMDLCVRPIMAGSSTITYTITFADNSTCTVTDVKNCPCTNVRGLIWADTDNDGIREPGEVGLNGLTVELVEFPSLFVVDTEITAYNAGINYDGFYQFTCVKPDTYFVRFTQPIGTGASLPFQFLTNLDSDLTANNGPNTTNTFTVAHGDQKVNIDAGYYKCCDFLIVQPTTDQCCSRIQSACPVDQVHVSVQNGTISTFDWGCMQRPNIYAFAGQTQFTLPIPAGCNFDLTVCVDPVYTNPYQPVVITYTTTFASGGTCVKTDTIRCPCGIIKGEAWYDRNGDGIYNPLENGFNGLNIHLVDAMSDKIIQTTVTDSKPGTGSDEGYYIFCVKPGMYYIKFDSPGDYDPSLPYQGSHDSLDSDMTHFYGLLTTDKITLSRGDTICDIDGGFMDKVMGQNNGIIMGHVTAVNQEPLSGAKVTLYRSNSNNTEQVTTNQNGNFAFQNLPTLIDYYTVADYTGDPMLGVSTLDLILIQRHILGIQPFDHPVKYIAADANMSSTVTAADLVEIRKLILGISNQFGVKKSWRFVPKSLPYAPDKNPFPVYEQLFINYMTGTNANNDFFAVKLGDVSGNALPVNTNPRSSSFFNLNINDVAFVKGEELTIPVYASQDIKTSGLQMSVNISNLLTWKGFGQGSLKISAEQYRCKNNILNISHVTQDIQEVKKGEIMFTLVFNAKSNGYTKGSVLLNPILTPEIYDESNTPVQIRLNLKNPELNQEYQLYPPVPNPFTNETVLRFNIPVDETITFHFYTLDGKLVLTKKEYFFKGQNQISVKGEELSRSGTYFVKMISNESTKIRKVIYLQ